MTVRLFWAILYAMGWQDYMTAAEIERRTRPLEV